MGTTTNKILFSATFSALFLSQNIFAMGAKLPEEGKAPPSPSPAPLPKPEVVHEMRWEPSNPRDGRGWTLRAYDEVGNVGPSLMSTTPSDVEAFCPNFKRLSNSGRRNFYVYLLSAMSKFESNYNPKTQYKEDFNDAQGRPVISRGLLQISKESANGYGCNINNAEELHDGDTNLRCALKIIDRWIGRDGVISGKSGSNWRGGARYWSVLRKESRLEPIKEWTREFCETKLR